jgi:hypothetical protein
VSVWLFVAVLLAQLQRRRREAEALAERAFDGAPIGVALAGRAGDSADRGRTGCRSAQGYLFFSPPVPGQALADLLAGHPA